MKLFAFIAIAVLAVGSGVTVALQPDDDVGVTTTTTTNNSTTTTSTTVPMTLPGEVLIEPDPEVTPITDCEGGPNYPEGYYTGVVPQETPDDPRPDPDACPEEYLDWVERQTETPQVVHCITDIEDGFFWAQGDPAYTVYRITEGSGIGLLFACIGITPSEWVSRPGVADRLNQLWAEQQGN